MAIKRSDYSGRVKEVEELSDMTSSSRAKENEHFQKVLTDKIVSVPGVVHHETMIG
jgi:hypothetical protein